MARYEISFPETDPATRSRHAQQLKRMLESITDSHEVELVKERPDTLDAGTIISIVLAGPALIAAVRAVHAWGVRENQTEVEIKKPDGSVVRLRNARSTDVEGVVRELEQ